MNSKIRIPPISMDLNIEYLLQFLQDELRDLDEIRIHPVAPSGTVRSPDLPQDYDTNANRVHLNRGVRVRVGARDYFFPVDWVIQQKMDLVRKLAAELREYSSARNS